MQLGKIRKISCDIVLFGACLLLLLYITPKAIVILLPFAVAYLISKCVSPLAEILMRKFKIPKRIGTAILITAIIAVLFLIFINLFYQTVIFFQYISQNLPQIINTLDKVPIVKSILKYYDALPVSKQIFIDKLFLSFKTNAGDIVKLSTKYAFSEARDFLAFLPSAAIFCVVLFLSAYFISNDNAQIKCTLKKILPPKMVFTLSGAEKNMIFALGGYARAQLVLMSITFTILFVGFSFMNIKCGALLAIAIALIDSLPVFGTGVVLLPWSFFSVIMGDYKRSIYIIIIYLAAMLTRQITEPKIISSKIGLHPLLTLFSMYMFLKIYGIGGMILGPVFTLVFLSCWGFAK